MFCPNCGTQNESTATPCKKCGFKLSGVSVPKFKGTMVLNSEQTVQEMIDENRRRAQGSSDRPKPRTSEPPRPRASEPPPTRGTPSAPPPPGSRSPLLSPPRASAVPRRRMGGTMLGVAPPAGGIAPPAPELTATPPPVRASQPPPAPARASGDEAAALATTETALAASEPAAAEPEGTPAGAGPGYTRPFAMPGVTAGPGHTRPLAIPEAVAGPGHTRPLALPSEPSAPDEASPPPAGEPTSDREGASDVREAPAERAPAVAPTAAMPQVADVNPKELALQPEPESKPASAALRWRPLDIVLTVCTLGVYGLVLWARRRRGA